MIVWRIDECSILHICAFYEVLQTEQKYIREDAPILLQAWNENGFSKVAAKYTCE